MRNVIYFFITFYYVSLNVRALPFTRPVKPANRPKNVQHKQYF